MSFLVDPANHRILNCLLNCRGYDPKAFFVDSDCLLALNLQRIITTVTIVHKSAFPQLSTTVIIRILKISNYNTTSYILPDDKVILVLLSAIAIRNANFHPHKLNLAY